MNTKEYQEKALELIRGHWGKTPDFWHSMLGIASESGELLGIAKKCFVKDKVPDRDDLVDELGDLLWYITVCMATQTPPITYEECFAKNIVKLEYRDLHGKDKKAERELQKAIVCK